MAEKIEERSRVSVLAMPDEHVAGDGGVVVLRIRPGRARSWRRIQRSTSAIGRSVEVGGVKEGGEQSCCALVPVLLVGGALPGFGGRGHRPGHQQCVIPAWLLL